MKKLACTLSFIALWALVSLGATPGALAKSSAPAATPYVHVCASAPLDYASCMAILAVNSQFRPDSGPAGYHPADLQSAYNLPSASQGNGQTVAIVDAFDDPNAEADLGVYRSTFGLPACTTGNGCFKKVNQQGQQGNYPTPNAGWAAEISLDLDMVSAICPNCHILLVEADNNHFRNLGKSVNEAVKLGANAVSNSYSGNEAKKEIKIQANDYNHPGVAITASSGDSGYGTGAPAVFNTLTAIGGTHLTRGGGSRGWSETAWSGSGSGCSKYISKPSWQTDPDCSNRTVSDVSADADPATGVSVYDTFQAPGWQVYGGTSVSSPIIASVYALAGNEGSINYGSYPYLNYNYSTNMNDVTSGSNGNCGNYICNAGPGYDGPTGLGTPEGTGAF
ncbi:MAG TPA: S53 family peptidase [Ktedonobacteraceae bacterium]|nr:S53 family peptidase [Ktedonobacteraceae bacterium]